MIIGLPVYPGRDLLRGLAFNVKWAPQFYNMPTQTAASGADLDLALASEPLHDFELTYDHLHDWGRDARESMEFRTMAGFFLTMRGSVGRFLFKWDDDDTVAQQLIGTGDGTTTAFTLVRTLGTERYGSTESIGALNTDETFNVYVGGNPIPVLPSAYTLDTSAAKNQLLTLATAPAAGQEVRVDMSYYYYCKFPDSACTFEKFMERLWLLNSIKIHSCRQGA